MLRLRNAISISGRMNQTIQNGNYIALRTLAISCLVVLISFLWQGNKGFNLWDEGYLWYGVQRVLLGEVPIRDFMAYDPGRYYWSATLMSVMGDNSIMGVRASVAIFQALGLFSGLFIIARSQKDITRSDYFFLVISAVTLVVWMFPRHKLFDISISIFLIGLLTYLISNPIRKRYVIVGACVGLVAVFGRNHGIYGAIASLGVIAWLSINNGSAPGFFNRVVLWGLGVAIGFLPVVFMALFVPKFAAAFWESICFLFELQATNLPLPVPWPWTINFKATSINDAVRGVLIGIFFIGTVSFGFLSVVWVVYRKLKEKTVPPPIVASAFLALPYAHFAFSRADIGHLALGIFPLLVGSLVIISSYWVRIKCPLAVALCTTSFWVMHVYHPGWQCFANQQCVPVEISGNNLQVDPRTANDIALLRQFSDKFAPNGLALIVTPFWPGAYALLERKSPIWEIFAVFPRSQAFEMKEIERIKVASPGFVFVLDLPLDGLDKRRYKNTHPLTYQYILNNYDQVPSSISSEYQVYKARGKGPI